MLPRSPAPQLLQKSRLRSKSQSRRGDFDAAPGDDEWNLRYNIAPIQLVSVKIQNDDAEGTRPIELESSPQGQLFC